MLKICWNTALSFGVVTKADEAPIALYSASVTTTCSNIAHWPKICWNIALIYRVTAKADEAPIALYDACVVITCSHSPHWP